MLLQGKPFSLCQMIPTHKPSTHRSYRAPELLFSSKTYDARASDLWSLGATIAVFFTPLRFHAIGGEEEDEPFWDEGSGSEEVEPRGGWVEWEKGQAASSSESSLVQGKGRRLPFILHSKNLEPETIEPIEGEWIRVPLFEPVTSESEISLAWSIFQLMGTPNETSWPVSVHRRHQHPRN